MENSNSEFPPLPTALGNPADRAGFPHSHSADGGFYIDTTFKLLPTRPSDRFCAPLEFGVRDCGADVRRLAGGGDEPVLRLARALRANEHHGWVPRDFGLEAWEKRAILEFYDRYPLEGYRRLTFMMLDANVVAASVWRVLHAAGRLLRWNRKASSKGQGFQPPLGPHKHWHVDISYVNLAGSVLDSYSRYLVPGSCGNR